MLVKGYSLSEIYRNGKHNFNEKALQYDGNQLQLLNNDDGNIEYKNLSNDELLKFVGSEKTPLMDRLQDEISYHSKPSSLNKYHISEYDSGKTKSRPKTLTKSKTKSRNRTKSKSKPRTKSRTRTKSKTKSRPKTMTTRKSKIKSRQITPDILKTIY
jgi:hypothetical protein